MTFSWNCAGLSAVMPGLVPGIPIHGQNCANMTGMAGTSPAMTKFEFLLAEIL
jgi:hypothetical protein